MIHGRTTVKRSRIKGAHNKAGATTTGSHLIECLAQHVTGVAHKNLKRLTNNVQGEAQHGIARTMNRPTSNAVASRRGHGLCHPVLSRIGVRILNNSGTWAIRTVRKNVRANRWASNLHTDLHGATTLIFVFFVFVSLLYYRVSVFVFVCLIFFKECIGNARSSTVQHMS